MTPDENRTQIRSFRVVFALERRIHRVDRWRIPVPYGIPVRGLAYAAATLAIILTAAKLPGLSAVVAALPPPVRLVLLPAAAATGLMRLRVDGRPAHRYLAALARHHTAPRTVAAGRPLPVYTTVRFGDVALAAAPAAPDYRLARIDGPCRVLLRYPFRATQRGRRLVISRLPGTALWRGKEITLQAGQQLQITGARR